MVFRIWDFLRGASRGPRRARRLARKVKLMQPHWIGPSRGFSSLSNGGRRRADRGLHHPAEAHGGKLRRHLSRPSAGGQILEKADPKVAAIVTEAPRGRHHGGGDGEGREARLRHRASCAANADPRWQLPFWIANFILNGLRHRRDLRLPAHAHATSTSPGITGRRLNRIRAPRAPFRARAISRPSAEGDTPRVDGVEQLTAPPCAAEVRKRCSGTPASAASTWHRQRGNRCNHRLYAESGGWGQGVNQYRLRDWGLSRQRYGVPNTGRPLRGLRGGSREEGNLPFALPTTRTASPIDFGVPGTPLDRHPHWRRHPLPTAEKRRRETDTK